jgi:hypothetical protein
MSRTVVVRLQGLKILGAGQIGSEWVGRVTERVCEQLRAMREWLLGWLNDWEHWENVRGGTGWVSERVVGWAIEWANEGVVGWLSERVVKWTKDEASIYEQLGGWLSGCVCALFNDAVNISDHTLWVVGQLIGNKVQESNNDCGGLSLDGWRKATVGLRIAGIPVAFPTRHLPNTNQNLYRLS